MRQVTQNYRSGRIKVDDVNAPAGRDRGILVRTAFSVISAGTEGMKVREGKMSLLGKARARPDQVKKVVRSVKQQGLAATMEKVFGKLDSLTPLGYSLSGTVIEVGRDAGEFNVGQRVACAGAEYAQHADVVFVPRNLAAAVPDEVPLQHAAFATVGAIALQGFRRAGMQLGESACVIGLGLLGQLLIRILDAAGMRSIGVDLSQERCALARAAGASLATTPDDPGLRAAVARQGGGGVDCVFITAGGDSKGPVELAVELARDRARVVDIGKTRIELSWNDYYMKEIDFLFSRSYGPGRYDPSYEEQGVDYPIGYVRWTLQRNMTSFLELIARGRMDLEPLVSGIHPVEEAEQVYDAVARGSGGLGILFRYTGEPDVARRRPNREPKTPPRPQASLGLGVIGAGNYAQSMLLPHFARHGAVRLAEVVTRTPLSAANAQRRFPFQRSSTDLAGLLEAADVSAVVIATRHSSHAALTARALRTGRPVFVEKPLAIDREGVEAVRQAVAESGNDRLQVGFNRRFAPLVREIATAFAGRGYPLFMLYRVHAGRLDASSWYLQGEEGSRFVGEAGHFLDVFAALACSAPVSVYARSLKPDTPDDRDNLSVTVGYADGSVGTLVYLTQGASSVPKEELEVFGGGRTARLHNFSRLELHVEDRRHTRRARVDKGQKAEVEAFVDAVVGGRPMPMSFESIVETTLATLAAEESLKLKREVRLAEFWAEADATPGSTPAR